MTQIAVYMTAVVMQVYNFYVLLVQSVHKKQVFGILKHLSAL